MKGKIIRGIAGFYYVHTGNCGIYTCKAKGIFRKLHVKPLVGDDVELSVLDEKVKEGNVDAVFPRRSTLIRPEVANIDQALVLFAVRQPAPNLNLLDRFLVMMERQGLPSLICFNKADLLPCAEEEQLRRTYGGCGYRLLFTSAKEGRGIGELQSLLRGRTTAMAGPSGVGKSSLTNLLQTDVRMETGAVSEKIARGRHTTRHSELIRIEEDTYIMDTPGFSSLELLPMEKEELRHCYPEFAPYEGTCRFQGCVHIHEPGCQVTEALEKGKISRERYANYCLLYEELKGQKRYQRRKNTAEKAGEGYSGNR